MEKAPNRSTRSEPLLEDLVFVGFNRRVIALDRYDGRIIWEWRASKGSGFVAIVLDGDRLIVSVSGYTYCLDPLYGQEVWFNELKGMGIGTPSLVTLRGSSDQAGAAATVQQQQQRAAT